MGRDVGTLFKLCTIVLQLIFIFYPSVYFCVFRHGLKTQGLSNRMVWKCHLLACLFRIKKSSYCDTLLSSKNFNVAHYSKNITAINTKLGILIHHGKMQLQGKRHNS